MGPGADFLVWELQSVSIFPSRAAYSAAGNVLKHTSVGASLLCPRDYGAAASRGGMGFQDLMCISFTFQRWSPTRRGEGLRPWPLNHSSCSSQGGDNSGCLRLPLMWQALLPALHVFLLIKSSHPTLRSVLSGAPPRGVKGSTKGH